MGGETTKSVTDMWWHWKKNNQDKLVDISTIHAVKHHDVTFGNTAYNLQTAN
jgi:hypothetical protein